MSTEYEDFSKVHKKLSVKISELTEVVHRLFKAKYKVELELQYLKDEFTKYLNEIKKQHKKEISVLQKHLNSAEDIAYKEKKAADENEKLMEKVKSLQEKYNGTVALMKLKDESLDHYRNENQTLIDTITNLKQTVVEKKHEGIAQEIENLKNEMARKDEKHLIIVEELEERICKSEKQLSKSSTNSEEYSKIENFYQSEVSNLKVYIRRLECDFDREKGQLETSDSINKQIMEEKKNIELENQKLQKRIKILKEELLKGDVKERDMGEKSNVANADEQIKHLQRRLQRYQLELVNRNKNYNEIFSSSQPVLLEDMFSKSLVGGYDLTGQKKRFSATGPRLPYLPRSSRMTRAKTKV